MTSDLRRKLQSAKSQIKKLRKQVATMNKKSLKLKNVVEKEREFCINEMERLDEQHKQQLARLREAKEIVEPKPSTDESIFNYKMENLKWKHEQEMDDIVWKHEQETQDKMWEHQREIKMLKWKHDFAMRKKDNDYDELRRTKKITIELMAIEKETLNIQIDLLMNMLGGIIRLNELEVSRANNSKTFANRAYQRAFSRHENGRLIAQRLSDDTNIPIVTQVIKVCVDMNLCKINNERASPLCEEYERIFEAIGTEKEEIRQLRNDQQKKRRLEKYERIQRMVSEESIENMRKNMEVIYGFYPDSEDVKVVRDTLMDFEFKKYMELIEQEKAKIEAGRIEKNDIIEDIFDQTFMATYSYLLEDKKFKKHLRMEEGEASETESSSSSSNSDQEELASDAGRSRKSSRSSSFAKTESNSSGNFDNEVDFLEDGEESIENSVLSRNQLEIEAGDEENSDGKLEDLKMKDRFSRI